MIIRSYDGNGIQHGSMSNEGKYLRHDETQRVKRAQAVAVNAIEQVTPYTVNGTQALNVNSADGPPRKQGNW